MDNTLWAILCSLLIGFLYLVVYDRYHMEPESEERDERWKNAVGKWQAGFLFVTVLVSVFFHFNYLFVIGLGISAIYLSLMTLDAEWMKKHE